MEGRDDSLTRRSMDTDADAPPPAYELLASQAAEECGDVTSDGRINVNIDSKVARTLSRFIPRPPDYSNEVPKETRSTSWSVKLNIVIQVVGSRGDVQPFIALGNELQKYGHRVRLATHDTFQNFVQSHGLEFYPIGGNPEELMAYMVKNPGLLPSVKTLRQGEIQKKRQMIAEMLQGCWSSCIQHDPVSKKPFVADAIIANPPSFAHIHCAQALGIPVHIMFTMPWSNTRAFPHPLANLSNAGEDESTSNFVSYSIVEWMTWQGLGDVINNWRRTLDLEPVSALDGPNLASALKIPHTYCWSPSLIPKPVDWPSHIDVCGFFFREAPTYTPPPDLAAFLQAGPSPIYIGFGSIVIDDPEKMSRVLLAAVKQCGVRAVISRGWSKLGGPPMDDVLYLGDCPHEWLFQRVSAVVHHGGAGTTACGLLNGKPTAIVPFFGDQQFWGNMIAIAGAGPKPLPHQTLTVQNLSEAITFCLTPDALAAAQKIATNMSKESGVRDAVKSFHANLPLETLPCDLVQDQPASWIYKTKGKTFKLSKIATEVLLEDLNIEPKKMAIHESKPIIIETRYYDPVSGIIAGYGSMSVDTVESLGGIFYKPYQVYRDKNGRTSANSTPTPSLHSPSTSQLGSLTTPADNGEGSSKTAQQPKPKELGTGAAMALASSKSLGNFFIKGLKGIAVDIPLATTEGFRNVPALYGNQTRKNESVTDWKSGAIVGGKNFYYGLSEGFTDIVTQPIKGGKESGTMGAIKGVGKGVASLTMKTSSACLGLVAYPGQGISKSIWTAVNSGTRKKIVAARHSEGQYLLRPGGTEHDRKAIVAKFYGLTRATSWDNPQE